MKALTAAFIFTIAAAVAMVVIFGSAALTFHLFGMFVVMTEGWQLVAALVWLLEMIFTTALFLEVTS